MGLRTETGSAVPRSVVAHQRGRSRARFGSRLADPNGRSSHCPSVRSRLPRRRLEECRRRSPFNDSIPKCHGGNIDSNTKLEQTLGHGQRVRETDPHGAGLDIDFGGLRPWHNLTHQSCAGACPGSLIRIIVAVSRACWPKARPMLVRGPLRPAPSAPSAPSRLFASQPMAVPSVAVRACALHA